MTEAEILQLVKRVTREEVAKISLGTTVSTESSHRQTAQRFSAETPIGNLRKVQPYGVASRAPVGTPCLIVPVGGDPTHLNVVGEFDANRPSIQDGESALYGADGQLVYLKSGGRVLIGSHGATSPLVLGDVLQTFADQLISQVKAAISAIVSGPVAITTTPGNPAPTYPALVSSLQNINSQLDTIKSQFVDTASSNFLSQKNFTERGGS